MNCFRTVIRISTFILLIFWIYSCRDIALNDFNAFSNRKEGKGPIIDKTYDYTFNAIEQSNGIQTEIYKSEMNKVVVSAPDDIIQYIEVEQTNQQKITIRVKPNTKISTKKVLVKVFMKELQSLVLNSGSKITLKDTFLTDRINLSTHSGSELVGFVRAMHLNLKSESGSEQDLSIQAKNINVQSSSGSTIQIDGYAEAAKLESSSGSEIEANDLIVRILDAEANSGSSIEVSTISRAQTNASSGGDIVISKKSNNFEIQKQVSSGGHIEIK